MKAQSRTFTSKTKTWEAISNEAAAFAALIGRERLITISVVGAGPDPSAPGGTMVVVWYWQ